MSETPEETPEELPWMTREQLRILAGTLKMLEGQLREMPVDVLARTIPALDPLKVFAANGYASVVADWRARVTALRLATIDQPGAVSSRPRTIDHRKQEDKPA